VTEDRLDKLFRDYYRPVFYFFRKRGFPAEESHDLAQETFLRAYRGLDGLRADACRAAWLFQIAANLYRNEIRSRSARKREGREVPLDAAGEHRAEAVEPEDPALSSAGGGPLGGVLAGERQQQLREALEELPPQMKRCVLLRVDQDMRYREIAEVMRVSIDTVKAHLFQARQQLRVKLSGYFAGPEM
jgi:RNA polymerase sigma-70 factor, ECF subfamily